MRYCLRTLLIVLALGPPVLAGEWSRYSAWKAEHERKSKRIHWMISPLAAPKSYTLLPKTVGELELHRSANYVEIDFSATPPN